MSSTENPYAQPGHGPEPRPRRKLRPDERAHLQLVIHYRDRTPSIGALLYSMMSPWSKFAVLASALAAALAIGISAAAGLHAGNVFVLFLTLFVAFQGVVMLRDIHYLLQSQALGELSDYMLDFPAIERMLRTDELPGRDDQSDPA